MVEWPPYCRVVRGATVRRRHPDRGEPRLKSHIKQHRARLDLTQEDLAKRVGVRRQTILAIEKGHYVPSALLAFLIARELGMRVDELFELVPEGEDGS
jgi:putative transcriptional regulator